MNDVLASLSTSNQAKAAPGDPGAVLCKTTCAGLSLHGALSGDFAVDPLDAGGLGCGHGLLFRRERVEVEKAL